MEPSFSRSDSVAIVKRSLGPFLNKAAIKAFSCKVLLKFLRSNPRKHGGMQWNAVNPSIPNQICVTCYLDYQDLTPMFDRHFHFINPFKGLDPNCPWARGWLARNHPCWCGSDVPQWGVGGIRWGGSWGVVLQASIKLEDLPEMWIVFRGKPMIFHSYLSWSGYFLHFNAYFHRFAVKTDYSICDSLLVAFILAEWSLQVSSPMALWDCTLTLISELSIWIRNINVPNIREIHQIFTIFTSNTHKYSHQIFYRGVMQVFLPLPTFVCGIGQTSWNASAPGT